MLESVDNVINMEAATQVSLESLQATDLTRCAVGLSHPNWPL